MSTISNKHINAQRIFYPSFDGGLNLSVPPESMSRNELQEAINVEFSPSSGAMSVRGGMVWSGRFDNDIDFAVPIAGRRGFLVRHKNTKNTSCFRWGNIRQVNGELSGTGDLSIVQWDNDYLVASGGKLQKFKDRGTPSLSIIKNSPAKCRQVFVKNGRAGVVTGDNELRFSGVGDCEIWDNDPDDDSKGQFIEIGYKDGMNIDAVIPLSRDLIIFKSPKNEPDKGTIFRLTGDYPDWSVLEAAHNTGTFSAKCVQAVGNDVYYITVSGLASLSAVTSYGEIQAYWPDRKVSQALTRKIDESAELWNVPVKQQLWLKPSKISKEIWVLDYIRGIWTKFQYPKEIIFASGVESYLYLFSGSDVYRIFDNYCFDEIKGEGKKEITALMKMGTIMTAHQILIKGAFASFGILPGCKAEVKLKNFCMPLSVADNDKDNFVYDPPNDEIYISEDARPLFPDGGVLTARRRCVVREWAVTPEVNIYGGGCWLSTMGLETAEV